MKKGILFALALAVAAIVALLLPRGSVPPIPPVSKPETAVTPAAATAPPSHLASELPVTIPSTPDPTTPDPRQAGSPLAKELNAPGSDATRDVAALHGMLRQYLRLLRQHPGHPIGNDSDLARVLTGHNPMKLVVLPPTHPALSPDGRLRDRWGTPYFIHPRGQGAFEIRSAGPDRQMFTADDAIANPPPGRTEVPDSPEVAEPAE